MHYGKCIIIIFALYYLSLLCLFPLTYIVLYYRVVFVRCSCVWFSACAVVVMVVVVAVARAFGVAAVVVAVVGVEAIVGSWLRWWCCCV